MTPVCSKFEIRSTKSETNPNIEIPNSKQIAGMTIVGVTKVFSISDFEFVSDFDIRISNLGARRRT